MNPSASLDVRSSASQEAARPQVRAPLSTAAVIRSHHASVLRYLRRRGATAEDALDMAQDAYLRLLKYEGATDIQSPPAMLFRIAGNVAADHVRAAALRHRGRSVDIDAVELASEQPSAERELSGEQSLAELARAITTLPPRCREIFLLSRMNGLTYAAIATRCGISVKTVEKHVSHALGVCASRSGVAE